MATAGSYISCKVRAHLREHPAANAFTPTQLSPTDIYPAQTEHIYALTLSTFKVTHQLRSLLNGFKNHTPKEYLHFHLERIMDVLFNQSAEMEANECFYLVPPSTNPALD